MRHLDPNQLFVDERLRGICCYCGAPPDTRDHIPSRVLLDEPFPANLPVVESCRACNEGFSQDEEYFACFIECVVCGTTDPSMVFRRKIRKILNNRPQLALKIQNACSVSVTKELVWQADLQRIEKVIHKLAHGHLAYDLNVFHFEAPDVMDLMPIFTMSHEEIATFEALPESKGVLYPEMGSSAFQYVFKSPDEKWYDWVEVQPERYRYRVEQGEDGDKVCIVVSEYLACRVIWM